MNFANKVTGLIPRCYICSSDNVSFLTDFFRGGRIYKCNTCKNAITVPKPVFNYGKTELFIYNESDSAEARSYVRPLLKFIMQFAPSGKLLDVGSGGGVLIEEANKVGFQAEGLEPSQSAVKLCTKKGLKVKRGFFEKVRYEDNYFDIVTLSHVLEHVSDTNIFLSKVHKILKRKGYIFLCQTNYTGTIPKILGKFWEGWVMDQHLVHFSPEGMKYMLGKNKFKLIRIDLISSNYRLLWRWGGFGVIATSIYYSVNFLLSKILERIGYQGDQMYVVATKN